MAKLTNKQTLALQFLCEAEEESVVLWQYLTSGHSLVTLRSLSIADQPLITWFSNTDMATCVLPSEYEHIRDTTSYVAITDAGRAALQSHNEGSAGK